MQRIADGIELEDGPIHADAISYATETDRNQAGIEIHSGRNRIVRRIFESPRLPCDQARPCILCRPYQEESAARPLALPYPGRGKLPQDGLF